MSWADETNRSIEGEIASSSDPEYIDCTMNWSRSYFAYFFTGPLVRAEMR